MNLFRITVRKKSAFAAKGNLSTSVVYDVEGLDEAQLRKVAPGVLYVDITDSYHIASDRAAFEGQLAKYHLLYALKSGQFDQRADAAEQCLRLQLGTTLIKVRSYTLVEADSAEALETVHINSVDTEYCSLDLPKSLSVDTEMSLEVGDISSSLSKKDLALIDEFFAGIGRKPTETEIKVLDTYWSDHCRHTTFNTELVDIVFEDHPSNKAVRDAYDEVLEMRAKLGRGSKPMSLMELATIDARYQRHIGKLEDLDVSEEINACSIKRQITDIHGNKHDYLVMFKNETHNHPTEIEPFGGAATCIGGAIRDPLSGRSYVYQSMRLTGAGDPYMKPEEVLPGKLLQKELCQVSAAGFSSYGNQVGLATGLVDEVYHRGYMAKRFEAGAVMGAVLAEHVVRERPQPGDLVLLLGGRTGRDGVGGATGSSTGHTDKSMEKSGAEVQKGNAPEERKLQRLFRDSEFSKRIKRCNDFGAGGVSVAVGELADSLHIYLDRVPLKYKGLTPTEIAVSESQERMAIVISPGSLSLIQRICDRENVESTVVAEVTDTGRVVMVYKNETVFDLPRAFIDTAGAKTRANVRVCEVQAPPKSGVSISKYDDDLAKFVTETSAAKRGMIELFDGSVGAATVLVPFGGKYMKSPSQVASAKVPLTHAGPAGESMTASLMAYGFNPDMSVSPFYMGMYSVLESVAKIVAAGGEAQSCRLSMQEFFPRMTADNWDLPFTALLGAGKAMRGLGVAAIGGKDSMSGNYQDITVPPSLVSFAFTTEDVGNIVTTDAKGGYLYLVGDHFTAPEGCEGESCRDNESFPLFEKISEDYAVLHSLVKEGKVTAAFAVGIGGVAGAVAKMGFGNAVGAKLTVDRPFAYRYGAIVVESRHKLPFPEIGETSADFDFVSVNGATYPLKDIEDRFFGLLTDIYPYQEPEYLEMPPLKKQYDQRKKIGAGVKVFIPVFPGTNSELDTAREFAQYGADIRSHVLVNKTEQELLASIDRMKAEIDDADILVLSGGFSAGDEPDGSAKFIASVFRHEALTKAIHDFLDRDGLILGICNGFQALVRLGLIPNGRIGEQTVVLDYNETHKHIAKMTPVVVESTNSPWMLYQKKGDVMMTPFSHGEGRFRLCGATNVEVATRYAERPMNGSDDLIEGAFAANGRIFGKMGHIERVGVGIYRNLPYSFDSTIIESGLTYVARKRK